LPIRRSRTVESLELQRLLPTALVLGLLVATASAFAVTEGLKLYRSPISGMKALRPFSPTCGCTKAFEEIRFKLRKADDVTVTIVRSGRDGSLRTIVAGHAAHAGWNRFSWNGRTDDGVLAQDGTYYARVALVHQHRTITLPNPIVLITQAPKVLAASTNRAVFSPDGDHESDSVTIRYRLSGRGHGAVYFDGHQILYTHFAPRTGTLTWYGRRNGAALPPAEYRLRVGAVDAAGNVAGVSRSMFVTVRIRYIDTTKAIYRELAGTRFSVGVDTDARRFRWRLGTRSGVAGDKHVVLRAPAKPGRYRLVVTENGHSAAAVVIAEPRG